MYKKILIATDGSELAARALEHGLKLAGQVGAEVAIVTVTEPAVVIGAGYANVAGTSFDPIPELIEAQEQAAKALLQKDAAKATELGLAAETVLVTNTYPADAIVNTAGQVGADLIVMGSHGRRGLGRLLLGSQTSNVLAHTKIPVLVTR